MERAHAGNEARNILIVCIPVTLPSELTEKLVITITITNLKSLSRTSKIENKKREEGHTQNS